MHYVIQGHISSPLERIAIGTEAGIFLSVYDMGLAPFAQAAQQGGQFPLLTEQEFELVEEVPLAREPLHSDGSFQIDMDDRQYFYAGGPLIPVLELTFLPPMAGPEAAFPSIYLVMDAFVPTWQSDAGSASCFWSKNLALNELDEAMAQLDVWCLRGNLVDHPTQRPVYPAQIEMFLPQVNGSQRLGLSETDPEGDFEIWYRLPVDVSGSTAEAPIHDLADLHFAASAQGQPLHIVGARSTQQGADQLKRIHKVDLATGSQAMQSASTGFEQPTRLRDLPVWGGIRPPMAGGLMESRIYSENYFGHRPALWSRNPRIGDGVDWSRAI